MGPVNCGAAPGTLLVEAAAEPEAVEVPVPGDSEEVVVVVGTDPVLDLLLRVPPNAAFGLVLLSVFAAAL